MTKRNLSIRSRLAKFVWLNFCHHFLVIVQRLVPYRLFRALISLGWSCASWRARGGSITTRIPRPATPKDAWKSVYRIQRVLSQSQPVLASGLGFSFPRSEPNAKQFHLRRWLTVCIWMWDDRGRLPGSYVTRCCWNRSSTHYWSDSLSRGRRDIWLKWVIAVGD